AARGARGVPRALAGGGGAAGAAGGVHDAAAPDPPLAQVPVPRPGVAGGAAAAGLPGGGGGQLLPRAVRARRGTGLAVLRRARGSGPGPPRRRPAAELATS